MDNEDSSEYITKRVFKSFRFSANLQKVSFQKLDREGTLGTTVLICQASETTKAY